MVTETPSCANPYCDRYGSVRVTFFGRYVAHTCDACIQGMVVGTESRRRSSEELLKLVIPVPVDIAQTDAERDDLVAMVRHIAADGVEYELRRKWEELQRHEAPPHRPGLHQVSPATHQARLVVVRARAQPWARLP